MESFKLFKQEIKNEQERKDTLANKIEENKGTLEQLEADYKQSLIDDQDEIATELKKKIDNLLQENKLSEDKLALLEDKENNSKYHTLADNVLNEAEQELKRLRVEAKTIEKEYYEIMKQLELKAREISKYRGADQKYIYMINNVANTLPKWADKQDSIRYAEYTRPKYKYNSLFSVPILKPFDERKLHEAERGL